MKLVSVDRLKNGMPFYGQFDRVSNLSGIGVMCGSIHDPPTKRGMAHLAEHVRCRYSEKYSSRQVDLILEEYMGGPDGDDINIRIDRVSTFFGHGSLLYPNHMFKSLDMMVSLLRDGILDAEGLDLEKAAIHQEHFVYGKDVAYNEVDDLMHKLLFPDSPVGNRIDCEPEELRTITLPQLRNFIGKFYSPSNSFMILLGPKFEKVRKLAKRYFEDLPERPVPVLGISGKFQPLASIREWVETRPGLNQYHVGVGFPTSTFLTNNDIAIDILARILAFRLRVRLRDGNRDFDKGVYRALSYTSRTFAHGMIYCWFATTSFEFSKQASDIVLEECEKLRSDLVLNDEFIAMRNSVRNYYMDAFMKTPSSLSELITQSACNGDVDLIHLHSFRDRLAKVSRKKIRDVANKYLTLPNYAKVLIKPV